ncbi:MAG: hypothetical protein LUQ31_01475 [Methanoregula sp.]|nr:hypothetical protein [Methanoregula sp.]
MELAADGSILPNEAGKHQKKRQVRPAVPAGEIPEASVRQEPAGPGT